MLMKPLKIAIYLAFLGFVLNASVNFFNPSKKLIPTYIQGTVFNVNTDKPIPDAEATVEYLIGWFDWARPYKKSTLTSSTGHFKIKMDRGGSYEIRVEAKGYYPFYSAAKTFLPNHIRLYPINDPQDIKQKVGKVGIENGNSFGYNFKKGEATFNLKEADIFIKPVVKGSGIYKLVANGTGGFIRIKEPSNRHYKMYNASMAPANGYKKEMFLTYDRFCYFRTADGKHFGKIEIGSKATGRNSLCFGFHYSFQPKENNRNLEIKYDGEYKFNLKEYKE